MLPNMNESNVPDVRVAIEQWDAYQKLCKGLLNDTDYQKIEVKQKDKNGKWIKVEKQFKKKSAWQKLSRALNVDTAIVNRELVRTNTGRVKEAYYCISASLPNGRRVESDALCSRTENGKDKVSDHTIMATAKTRATNRAISELIGAGEVSAEELDQSFDKSNSHDDVIEAEVEEIVESAYDTSFSTAQELKEKEEAEAEDGEEDRDKVYRTAGDVLTYATRLSKDNTSGNILKNINKLHAPLDLKQNAREQLIQNSIMIQKYDNKLTCAQIFSILKERIAIDKLEPKPSVAMKILGGYNRSGLCDDATCRKVANYLLGLKLNDSGEFL